MSTQIQSTPIVSGEKAKEIEELSQQNYDQKEINKAMGQLNKEFAPKDGLMGWICPVCGRGLSPYTNYCPCTINCEITCGTGTPLPQQGETISHLQQDNVSANTYSIQNWKSTGFIWERG